jgi:hypothetical protein
LLRGNRYGPGFACATGFLPTPRSQHDDIRSELLHQRSSKTKTLVVADGEAAAIARRIISRVSEPFEFAPAAQVGVSIGLASAPRDGSTADELLSAADRAMYDAKRRGKGSFVVHASGVEVVSLVPSADADAGLAAELADSAA